MREIKEFQMYTLSSVKFTTGVLESSFWRLYIIDIGTLWYTVGPLQRRVSL